MPSGVYRTRASRTNHPMPMLANPYSGDISGLRGRKTRDSATLVERKEPSAPDKTRPFVSSKSKSTAMYSGFKTGSGQYFVTGPPREAEHSVIGGPSYHPDIPAEDGHKRKGVANRTNFKPKR